MLSSSKSNLTRRNLLTVGVGAPFAIALGGCGALTSALQPLVGQIISLQLRDISSGFVNMGMGLNVFNPNPIGLPELGLNLNLSLAEKDIANFGTASPFSLPGEGDTDLDLGVGINAVNTITTLLSFLSADAIPYQISGQAETPQLGGLTLPLNASGSIPLT